MEIMRPTTNSSCAAATGWSSSGATARSARSRSADCARAAPAPPAARNGPSRPSPSGGLHVLSLAEARPLKILGMKPVGNYAYSIAFSDGHDTGIFTLELLRELGSEVPQ